MVINDSSVRLGCDIQGGWPSAMGEFPFVALRRWRARLKRPLFLSYLTQSKLGDQLRRLRGSSPPFDGGGRVSCHRPTSEAHQLKLSRREARSSELGDGKINGTSCIGSDRAGRPLCRPSAIARAGKRSNARSLFRDAWHANNAPSLRHAAQARVGAQGGERDLSSITLSYSMALLFRAPARRGSSAH